MSKAPKTVKLTELEYHKLLRYMEAVTSTEAQSELILIQLRGKIDEARKVKDQYLDALIKVYPDLRKDVAYSNNDSTFELVPNVNGA